MADPYKWESMEQYYEAVPSIQRFPIDSKKYKNKREGSYEPRIIFGDRAGEFTGSYVGIYTYQEVYDVFMESTTEYEAAKKLVSDWEHWVCVIKYQPYIDIIARWRIEKEIKNRLALTELLWRAAKGGSVAAQKLLLEENNKNDLVAVSAKGKEIQKELEQKAKEKEAVQAIKDSLKLVAIDGKRKKA